MRPSIKPQARPASGRQEIRSAIRGVCHSAVSHLAPAPPQLFALLSRTRHPRTSAATYGRVLLDRRARTCGGDRGRGLADPRRL